MTRQVELARGIRDRARRLWWPPFAVALLGAILAAWAPGPTVATNDEPLWVIRSAEMREALHTGDLDRAIAINPLRADGAATQPGVTTMVLGALGEDLVRVLDSPEATEGSGFLAPRSALVLRAGQVLVAAVCGATLGLLTWLLSLTIGRRAAAVAGALLAVEPFLLGHMGVLHTDAMVTLFGASSVAALAAVLLAPGSSSRRRTAALVAVAAATGALALLTKLLALVVLATGGAVVVGVAVTVVGRGWRRRGGAPPWSAVTRVAVVSVSWAASTVVLAMAGHPRMWVAPGDTFDRVWRSREIASGGAPVFFRGEVTNATDGSFLWVTTPFRMSPWLLVLGVVAVVAAGWWLVRPSATAPRRPLLVLWLTWPVLHLVAVGTQAKQYDRYALPVWIAAAVLVGMGADAGWRSSALTVTHRRVAGATAALVMVVAVAVAVTSAPHRTAYVSPLLGGQRRAERTIPLGWGEGLEVLGRTVEEREGPDGCDDTTLAVSALRSIVLPCGATAFGAPDPDEPYYLFVTVSDRQRPRGSRLDALAGTDADLIEVVDIGGVAYAELWYVEPGG